MKLSNKRKSNGSTLALVTGAVALAAVTAGWVERRARQAERDHPPEGRLLDIDGVTLHYVERGEGPPVVLIHGNMVSHRDFEASGLIDHLARTHRVVAFDRPGFGHSTRPRDRLWTPAAQAKLLHAALERLGIERAVVVGHSMGTMVAVAMALDFPADVRKLVLLGGYYYPSMRVDALLTAPVALPVLGDVMRYTVTAISARLMLKRAIKVMFRPKDVPADFIGTVSREMMLRPIQLRANAEDAAFMIGQAKSNSERHHELQLPVTIFAGAKDTVVDVDTHSARLHSELTQSKLVVVPGAGHMVHHAAGDQIVAAIQYDLPLHASLTEKVATSRESEAERPL
ncbi:MAG: alpha/beta fold hydrolase [Burkholderiaceae bacterium]